MNKVLIEFDKDTGAVWVKGTKDGEELQKFFLGSDKTFSEHLDEAMEWWNTQ